MDCTEFNGMLDLLMDGALSDGQRQTMEAHGLECPECAAAMRSTLQMKALFDQMEPEIDVPLNVQAKWRGAVREASKQQKQKRLRRWIVSVAAAVVVLAGAGLTLGLRGAPKQSAATPSFEAQSVVEMADAAAPANEKAVQPALAAGGVVANSMADAASANEAPGAVVEADGVAGEAVAHEEPGEAVDLEESAEATDDFMAEEEYAAADAAASPLAPACELSIQVEDVGVACSRVCDLAQEYEAKADVQTVGDGGANVYVEIAGANAGDFLSAVAAMDGSGKGVDVPELAKGDQVLILLVLHR